MVGSALILPVSAAQAFYGRSTVCKRIIEEGVESGAFRDDVTPEHVSAILFATADGLNLHYATAGVDFDWRHTEGAFLDLVFNGLLRR